MEEDIKILEELKEACIFNLSGFLGMTREKQKRTAYAIENLIKGYRELEENLKIATAMLTKGTYPEKNKGDNDFSKQFIPKSKIKEKMKKYEWAIESYDSDIADYKQSQDVGSWHALQELMEDK